MKFSSRLLRKGTLIPETRVVFQRWQDGESVAANVQVALADNPTGVRSANWLHEVVATLRTRLGEMPATELRSLAALARSGVSDPVWQACLHWHAARVDALYYPFMTEWLFTEYQRDADRLSAADVAPWVRQQVAALKGEDAALSEYGVIRAARDLLRTAADYGVLSRTLLKTFPPYRLPDAALLYLLHALAETTPNARRLLESPDWRLYRLEASEVEREVLRLHQHRQLHYDAAGSLAQLTLPYPSAADYAQSLPP
ncbi:MAG: DUF1819 family protein [Candidatus Competibacteraceae bacterium]|nr:DUF1819 family protein [Candidatus Competibacteraceae bacterium]